jgi:hypothetical protein
VTGSPTIEGLPVVETTEVLVTAAFTLWEMALESADVAKYVAGLPRYWAVIE